ncbi:DNA translocase FtsK 4TM domain-containing protein [Nocardia rhamnosiphila]
MSYPPPAYGYPAYGYPPPPDHPQATTVLILGIVGMMFCQVCAPFAWIMGRRTLNEIDASGGTVGGRSNVMVGYILGIIGSVLLILAVLAAIAYIVFVVVLINSA